MWRYYEVSALQISQITFSFGHLTEKLWTYPLIHNLRESVRKFFIINIHGEGCDMTHYYISHGSLWKMRHTMVCCCFQLKLKARLDLPAEPELPDQHHRLNDSFKAAYELLLYNEYIFISSSISYMVYFCHFLLRLHFSLFVLVLLFIVYISLLVKHFENVLWKVLAK